MSDRLCNACGAVHEAWVEDVGWEIVHGPDCPHRHRFPKIVDAYTAPPPVEPTT